jgi:hypothetical protein
MWDLRVNPDIIVANLPSHPDRLFEDEREFQSGYLFLELFEP